MCGDSGGSVNYLEDNYCHDNNNIEECQWDGGDCCGDNVNTQYCSICVCLDPGVGDSESTTAEVTTTMTPTASTITGKGKRMQGSELNSHYFKIFEVRATFLAKETGTLRP